MIDVSSFIKVLMRIFIFLFLLINTSVLATTVENHNNDNNNNNNNNNTIITTFYVTNINISSSNNNSSVLCGQSILTACPDIQSAFDAFYQQQPSFQQRLTIILTAPPNNNNNNSTTNNSTIIFNSERNSNLIINQSIVNITTTNQDYGLITIDLYNMTSCFAQVVSSVDMNNCTFANVVAQASIVYVQGAGFTNFFSVDVVYGSGNNILWLHDVGVVTIESNTFTEFNSVGHVVDMYGNDNITVSSSWFSELAGTSVINNNAGQYYTGFTNITSCTFYSNQVESSVLLSNGGASLLIADTKFSMNSAGGNGSAFYLSENLDTVIMNSTFYSGDSQGYGGAIYAIDSTVRLDNCNIVQNRAGYGGAIYLVNSSLSLTNTDVGLNMAIDNVGGAIACNSMIFSHVELNDGNTFYANKNSQSVPITGTGCYNNGNLYMCSVNGTSCGPNTTGGGSGSYPDNNDNTPNNHHTALIIIFSVLGGAIGIVIIVTIIIYRHHRHHHHHHHDSHHHSYQHEYAPILQ
ncbi:hypothetical protein DFA_08665 [Cavenderia fasciculata]|uniref:Right handed beta helix domain-containing protein n=1 Tax=Cavenderia fasciculata TaxID=261658 RepID=F4Q3L1_CACFS|nr:uncharacterized protein DFA_08665 [Cavenderia fasciculata]EGG17669.1 hypothetical protein DFA_08665 [Cavenderia fasciculata]|eukprot:XP_004356153.1 hypothetical protein DFA_08665 [Cavenderia fasciculata]